MLPNYKQYASAGCPGGGTLGMSGYLEVQGHGIVHCHSTDKGLLPMIAYEDFQPFYARKARIDVSKDPRFSMVAEGRPDAVLHFEGSLQSMQRVVPQWANKERQFRKAARELQLHTSTPKGHLPWKANSIHLNTKYEGLVLEEHESDWYSMPEEWKENFQWIWAASGNRILGAAHFAVAESGKEWFWCGTVQDPTDTEAKRYSIGNVLLMKGLELAHSQGAEVFNLGLDLYDYKPQMWGTVRQWDTGLEYVK